MTQDSLDNFMSSKGWSVGADAGITVVSAGASGTYDSRLSRCRFSALPSPLAVPPSAYIAYSGNDWTCVEGFRRHGEACVPD
jgi:hypothetical protein